MLGRKWAAELESRGMTVILVHPGSVATDLNRRPNLLTVKESAAGIL